MSSRDPDEARPIPQQPDGDWPSLAGARHGADDAYVVDTRRRRPAPSRAHRTPRSQDPMRAVRRAPAGTLYPEDRGYDGAGDAATSSPREAPPAGRRASGRSDGSGAGGPTSPGRPSGPGNPRRGSSRRGRRIRTVVGLVVVVLLAWAAFLVWVPINAWNNVSRVNDTPAGARPSNTAGHDYLLVGSDGRAGLTPAQVKSLNAGGAVEGQRTDSIILVHVPAGGGKAALVSIPRDSYVPIPGYGSNKINAAFAFGGAKLLVQTVEQATGIHLDGYIEIGFGGFASVVDSLGGVNVCVPFDMKDAYAAIDLKKGCQTLDGATALGYVRARHSDPRGDIGRAERQRQFLGAILKKAVTPSTVLIPWRYKAFADSASTGLTVGKDTSSSTRCASSRRSAASTGVARSPSSSPSPRRPTRPPTPGWRSSGTPRRRRRSSR